MTFSLFLFVIIRLLSPHPKKTSVYLPIGEIKKVTRQKVNELKSFTEKSNISQI